MKKILFVCMSNFCRSPLAQGLFEHIVKNHDQNKNFEIDSAGTHDYQIGLAPDQNSQAIAKQYGFDISHQTARAITLEDFVYFDYILAMDTHNLAFLKSMCPSQCLEKVELLMQYSDPALPREVPDPYQKGEAGFFEVYHYLENATQGLFDTFSQ